jgi:hypothetical protein
LLHHLPDDSTSSSDRKAEMDVGRRLTQAWADAQAIAVGRTYWAPGENPPDAWQIGSLSEHRARRLIKWIERCGWLVFLVDISLPKFTGPQALLTWPLFPNSLHFALVIYLLALRIFLLRGGSAKFVRLAAYGAAALTLAMAIEWFVFTPFFQGPSRYDGIEWAQIVRADGDSLDLILEDGRHLHAKDELAARFNIKAGQCRQIEILHGRFGVRWIEFFMGMECVIRPGEWPLKPGAMDPPRIIVRE